MNYELAKKLKDEGFPQGEPYNNYLYCDEHEDLEHTEECSAYIPTLEELIEACGEGFQNLNKFKDNWVTNFMEDENMYGDSNGATHTEAVANLWLSLNKKLK